MAGKIGVHSGDDMDIGSNAENILRLAPCNVLLVSGKFVPPVDVKAEAAMVWTEEAAHRFERVPESVRSIARTAVHRYAMERGHSIITNDIISEVMALFMPKTAGKLQEAALEIAKEKVTSLGASGAEVYICSTCGKLVRGTKPVLCTVCNAPGEAFGRVTPQDLEDLSEREGELRSEETFDGTQVSWTLEARKRVSAIKDGYIRRRAKAQLEKTARTRRIAIDAGLVDEVLGRDVKNPKADLTTPHVAVENELPSPLPVPEKWSKEAPQASLPVPPSPEFLWSEQAAARLNRVPAGFMRDNTRLTIEEVARQMSAATITLEVAEAGISRARELMAQMIAGYAGTK